MEVRNLNIKIRNRLKLNNYGLYELFERQRTFPNTRTCVDYRSFVQ